MRTDNIHIPSLMIFTQCRKMENKHSFSVSLVQSRVYKLIVQNVGPLFGIILCLCFRIVVLLVTKPVVYS